jgi:hypothetical protein
MKGSFIKNFTIDTPNKYWAVINGYHIHKSLLGALLVILGTIVSINNLKTGVIVSIIGLAIIIIDIIGHIHTNWHKKIVFIEKHKGLTYKKGGYKKMEVKK